ncbi:MAG TPA: response regulator [Chryseosolibacter sp.]|nr:response regulator [Chryseosolibacter sp.]
MSKQVNKVMLIDDSDLDLFIHRRLLELSNFSRELISCKSAERALESLKNLNGAEPPNIIFLDLNMPVIDGFSFLKLFSQLPENVTKTSRIVVLTSSNASTDREQVFLYENVIHMITKPIKQTDIEELRMLVTD